MRAVPRSVYRHDALVVAPALLNKLLVVGERAGRIVEVEAYRADEDPGSHAYRGLTRRNATMFGPPGHLYVYFSYGMHWCANVVCQPEGIAHAVLLRALAPVAGIDQMREARTRGQMERARTRGQMERARTRGEMERARTRGRMDRARAQGQKRAVSDRDLCRGPGRLCRAMGITGQHDGADLTSRAGGVRLMDDGTPPPLEPGVSLRVGLTQGADLALRFFVAGDRYVSGPRA